MSNPLNNQEIQQISVKIYNYTGIQNGNESNPMEGLKDQVAKLKKSLKDSANQFQRENSPYALIVNEIIINNLIDENNINMEKANKILSIFIYVKFINVCRIIMNFLNENLDANAFTRKFLNDKTISIPNLPDGYEYVYLFCIIFLKLNQCNDSFEINYEDKIYQCNFNQTSNQPRNLKIQRKGSPGLPWSFFDNSLEKSDSIPEENEFLYKLLLANEAARRLDENDVYYYLPIFSVIFLFLGSDKFIKKNIVTHQQIFDNSPELKRIISIYRWQEIFYPVIFLERTNNIIAGIQKIIANNENYQNPRIRNFIEIVKNDQVATFLSETFNQLTSWFESTHPRN